MKSKRGGYRKGSGAKLKYGEKMETFSAKVPISLIAEISEYVELKKKMFKLKKYESKGKG